MVNKNKKILLIYGFDYDEQQKLNELLKVDNLPLYKVIYENMVNWILEDILSNDDKGMSNSLLQKQKVILFNQCSDDEIKIAMRAIKASYTGNPIFAVITPTSIHWEFNYLLQHLMEERSRFEKNT